MRIKKIVLDNGKEIPLWMICPKCRGKSASPGIRMTCTDCGNTGEVPRYWTPERVEKELGYEYKVHDSVYAPLPWKDDPGFIVYDFVGQPAPPAGWSDDEQQKYLEHWGEE